jgi:hypothetical protein
MGERTEVRAAAPAQPTPCPVCAEPLEGRPERCFRCETSLGAWWGFEEALAETELGLKPVVNVNVPVPVPVPEPVAVLSPPRNRAPLYALAALAAVLVGGFIVLTRPVERRVESAVFATPVTTLPPPASAEPTPPPAPQVIRYRVQRGDSLWRIAASLTGDGHCWRALWPQRTDAETPLRVGSVLDVDLARLPSCR